MQMIRSFIAIELPEELRGKLKVTQQQIQAHAGASASRAVKWVSASNIHLTIKFLGDVPADQIAVLGSLLSNAAGQFAAFPFTISGLGAFPNKQRPRVIWVGGQAPETLVKLQKTVDHETQRLGYPPEERPFSPHLTLGRVGQHASPQEISEIARALGELKVGELGQVQVRKIHLFQSDLRPSGPIYTSLREFELAAGQERG